MQQGSAALGKLHGGLFSDVTRGHLKFVLRSARLGSNGLGSSTIITFSHYLAFLQSSVCAWAHASATRWGCPLLFSPLTSTMEALVATDQWQAVIALRVQRGSRPPSRPRARASLRPQALLVCVGSMRCGDVPVPMAETAQNRFPPRVYHQRLLPICWELPFEQALWSMLKASCHSCVVDIRWPSQLQLRHAPLTSIT